MSAFSRLCSIARVDQKIGSDGYPEMVGMVTLILGKAFGGLEDATFIGFDAGGGAFLSCFDTFSVGTREDVRGCFEVCPIGAATRSGVLAGS